MKWIEHASLSEQDMEYLTGTPLMEALQTNRIVVIYKPKEEQASFADLGLYEITRPFYMRKIDSETLEFFFSHIDDMGAIGQKLTMFKLSKD